MTAAAAVARDRRRRQRRVRGVALRGVRARRRSRIASPRETGHRGGKRRRRGGGGGVHGGAPLLVLGLGIRETLRRSRLHLRPGREPRHGVQEAGERVGVHRLRLVGVPGVPHLEPAEVLHGHRRRVPTRVTEGVLHWQRRSAAGWPEN